MEIGQQSIIPEFIDADTQQSNLDLLRRHSLSLRSPPVGSLAADILNPSSTGSSNLHLKKVQSMMKDVKEALTEFGSCVSASSESEADTSKSKPGGKKKRKRKKSLTPSKKYFLKRATQLLVLKTNRIPEY